LQIDRTSFFVFVTCSVRIERSSCVLSTGGGQRSAAMKGQIFACTDCQSMLWCSEQQ
jgi:hypothetical protein